MLSVRNLRNHCRTCLLKLGACKDEDNSKRFVLISKFPHIEQMMQKLEMKVNPALDDHVPNMCRACVDKWQDFIKHYQLAVKSDKLLRQILEKESESEERDKTDNGDKFNAIFIATEAVHNVYEIEKYETTSPFYQDSSLNDSSANDLPFCEDFSGFSLEDGTSETPPKIHSFTGDSSIFEDCKCDDNVPHNVNPKKVLHKSKSKGKKTSIAICKIRRKYKTKKQLYNTAKKAEKSSDGSDESLNKKLRYHCEPCKKYFYEIHKYEGHVKQIHKGIQRPYQCQDCQKAYNSYKNLTHHIAENHSEKSQEVHKCEECNKTFKTNVTLRQHMNNQHPNPKDSQQKEHSSCTTSSITSNSNINNREQTRTICDQCGFMAAHQYSLVQHIKNRHTEAKEIKCENCPKVFKSQYSLKYHMLSSHNPTNTKPFQCPDCQMRFTRRTLLNLHKRTHLKYTERIKCDFEGCDVRFVKDGDKRHHMRLVHFKVKQHICDFCGEAFGAMQTLRHHRYIHTGEKPYKCNVCGQGFRQRTAMKTHSKTHYGKEEVTRPSDMMSNIKNTDLPIENS